MTPRQQLEQQKGEVEQQIKQFADQLATLSDEAKEQTKQKIRALEEKREQLSEDIIKEIKKELDSASDEVKEALQQLIEDYERECWENESYYADVIAIIEQDNTESGKKLQQTLTKTKKQREKEQTKQVELSDKKISTYEILEGTDTKAGLLKVMDNKAFEKYGKNAEKRLERVFKEVHTSIKKLVLTQCNISLESTNIPPTITEVIVPAIERHLMQFLQGTEGVDNHANNITNLDLMNGISIKWFTDFLSSVWRLVGRGVGMKNELYSLTRALDFLSRYQNKFPQANQYEILRNPLKCKEFLEDGIWMTDTPIYDITPEQVGLVAWEQKNFWVSETEKQEVKNLIGHIKITQTPETTEKILNLTEKITPLIEAREGLVEGLMDFADKQIDKDSSGIIWLIKMIAGKNTINEFFEKKKKSRFWNIVCYLLGFSGVEWFQQKWYDRRINGQLDADGKNRRKQISAIFQEYFDTTKEGIKPENSLENEKIIKENKNYIQDNKNMLIEKKVFDIDRPALETAIKEKLDTSTLNTAMVKNIIGKKYITPKTDPNGIPEKDPKGNLIEIVNTEAFEQDKEKNIKKYITEITKYLVNNPEYLSTVIKDTENTTTSPSTTIAFTMISSLFVDNPEYIVDGIQAKVFLPAQFINEEGRQRLEQPPVSEQPTAQTEHHEVPAATLAEYTLDVIIGEESGWNYGIVNPKDGKNSPSVSIGLLQRHKPRAVALLKKLREKDETAFTTIMADPIFINLDIAGNSPRNDTQMHQFKLLMQGEQFKTVMKQQALEDVSGYIADITADGSITNKKAIVLYARLYNGSKNLYQGIRDKVQDKNNIDQILQAIKASDYVNKQYPELHLWEKHEKLVAQLKQDNIENLA